MHATHLVIGGGSAGCVMAARLSEEPGNNVVLAFADSRVFDTVTYSDKFGLPILTSVPVPPSTTSLPSPGFQTNWSLPAPSMYGGTSVVTRHPPPTKETVPSVQK